MFEDLDGDVALIHKGGVFKTVPIARKNTGEIFLRVGANAYVRAYDTGATSQAGVTIAEMHTDVPLFRDPNGRLTSAADKGKPIAGSARERLMLEGPKDA